MSTVTTVDGTQVFVPKHGKAPCRIGEPNVTLNDEWEFQCDCGMRWSFVDRSSAVTVITAHLLDHESRRETLAKLV